MRSLKSSPGGMEDGEMEGGRGMGREGMGGQGGAYTPSMNVLVRWQSAKPVQQALAPDLPSPGEMSEAPLN